MNGRALAAAIGVSGNALYGWRDAGYLHPTPVEHENSTSWEYSPGEVEIARKMAVMLRAGFSPRSAHGIARQLPDSLALIADMLAGVDPILDPLPGGDVSTADQAVLDASDLIVAVRDVDPRLVWRELERWVATSPRRLLAVVTALAAMVPADRPVSELLAWTDGLITGQGAA